MPEILSTTSTYLRAIRAKATNKQIFRALLSLASAALLVRVMGMLNQLVVTSHFGVGPSMDAYFISSAMPILLASLLGSVIEASVIPVYTRVRTQGNQEQTSRLFSTLFNLFVLLGVLVTLVMLFFRSPLMLLSAPGSQSNIINLSINLAPFIFPVFALMVVTNYLECILNTEGQFGWPAYAGMLVPLATAILVFTMGSAVGVLMLCVGMAVGLCLQLCAFIIGVRRAGLTYHFVLEVRHPEIAAIIRAAWPVLIGALIGQASNLIDQIFASFLEPGSISALNYSLKLVSVFTGVIFVSVGRAILPYLSQQASMNDMRSFKETLRFYVWIVGIGTTALSVLVILLAHPLVQLLFQRGAFTAQDTDLTATTFIGFAIGLTPIAFGFIAFRAFSALGQTRLLLRVTICSLLANALFDYIFARLWQGEGIALATSAAYVCSTCILFFMLRRLIGELHIFTPPYQIVDFLRKVTRSPGSSTRTQGNGILVTASVPAGTPKHKPPFTLPYSTQQHIARFGVVIAVFSMGVIGLFLNSLNTLRLSLGSIIILVLMRYNFLLLIGWILINGPNAMPIFRGSNVLIGLTIPTLLLMTTLPLKQTIKSFPALGFLGVYLLWASTSLAISPIGLGAAVTAWVLQVDCLAVSILAINVLTTRQRMLRCIDAVLLVSSCIAVYGIYGYFTRQNVLLDPTTSLYRIVSIFVAAPSLAFFLSIIFPLAIYRAFTLQGFKRAIPILVALVLLMAAALTFTRSAYIYIPVSILLMAFCIPSRQIRMAILGGTSALTIILVLLATIGNLAIFSRFTSQDIATLNGRTYLWQAILSHFDPTQLIGNGILASNALLTTLQVGVNGQGVIGTSPHALFLGTLYDHGIIGVVLLSILFIALTINLITGMHKASGERRILFAAALAVLASVILQSIDSNDFWDPAISIYIWIPLVLPFALCWSKAEQPVQQEIERLEEQTEPRLRAIRPLKREQVPAV